MTKHDDYQRHHHLNDDPTSTNNTVIILGAGLAGLSLALGLTTIGYRVELIEKNFDFHRTGATFGLARNGRKALDELYPGIADQLIDIGVHMPSTGGTMLGWWNVRDALLSRVQQEKDKINLRLGWMIQEIDNGENCVTAKFRKRNNIKSGDVTTTEDQQEDESSSSLILKGFVLIGADGVNSAVRQFHKLPSAKKANIVLWRGRLVIQEQDQQEQQPSPQGEASSSAASSSDLLRPYLDIPVVPMGIRLRGPMNYVLFNFHPKIPRTMALVINYQFSGDEDGNNKIDDIIQPGKTTPKQFMEDNAQDDETELEEIRAILDLTDKDGLSHPVRLKVVELPKEDGSGWGGTGRVTLTGDAAHGMRPASGQGGSMAFEDSVILCRVLQKLKEKNLNSPSISKSHVEEALQEFENTRLPRVRKIWDDQWERSEKVYQNIEMEPWSEEFSEWVFNGV